jgi:hypothetical protein
MNNKKVKRRISILLIIGVLALFIGYKIYNKPHLNVAQESADIRRTANMLLADFSTDETKANTKYLDKIIAVKGIVSSADLESEKRSITLLTTDNFGSVICYLTEDNSQNSMPIKVGQAITLKGICTGFLMDVILVKCVITDLK